MDHIGHYKITKTIAEGGMAIVYQGIQSSLNRPVAVKVLKQIFSEDPRVVSYFNRESLIIARLIHPNIIHVIDRGLTDQGMPYFVMDYIEGIDTSILIRKGNLTFNRKLDIIVQTCKALAYAHKNGIIHRDIKPANILIDTEGNALVTDFGIAQFYKKGETIQKDQTREVLGTPTYMSPEQKENSSDVSFASDIYSLGVVMYELFTEQRFQEPLKRPSTLKKDIPESLDRLILMCLLPDPEQRPASVETIKNQLFSLFQGAHIRESQKQKAFSGVPAMDDIATVLDVIRESPESSVYLLRHKQSESLMVAKTFNAMSERIKASRLLLSLRHDNIITVQGVSGSGNHYIVITEYLSGGSLADRMVMPQSQQEAVRILGQVCRGLLFAHNNRIAHGNLKPSNILFTETDRVKLSDFMPPAQRSFQDSITMDILSVGAIFYKMILGFNPELNGDSFIPHKQFKNLSDDMKRFIFRLLTQKPQLRFQSMKHVLEAMDTLADPAHPIDETVMTLDGDLSDRTQKTPGGMAAHQGTKPVSAIWFIGLVMLFLLAGALVLGYVFAPGQTRNVLQSVFQDLDTLIKTFQTLLHRS